MPLPLALPIGFLIGMSLAWLARAELLHSELPLVIARPFLIALGLGALVFGPVVAYFVAMHGDWAYLYLVRVSRIPSAVDLLLVIVAAAHVPFGFAVATPWARAKRSSALLKLALGAFALVALGCALASRRLGVSASYAQFHGGFGVAPLAKTSLGRGVLLSWVTLFAAYVWSLHVLRAPARSE